MIFLTSACLMMIPLMSPIKIAFTITTASLMVSLTAYSMTLSVFPSAGMVISFSSGMMILFCYCAMMTNYESKNTTSKVLILSAVILASTLQMSSSTTQSTNNLSTSVALVSSPFLMTGMMVIVVAMVCINKVMYSPKKTMISTY